MPSEFDRDLLESLLQVQDRFISNPMPRLRFMEVMGMLRDAIKRLECKIAGCPTGIHAGSCSCKPGIPGRSIRT